jgi:cytochrome c peroxidase
VPDESVFEGLNTAYPVLEYPADNPNNAAAASLGERLFFDPILSVDSSISCGGEEGNRTLGDFVFYRCHEF